MGVVAPASVTYEKIEIDYAGDVLRALGLEPRFGANVRTRFGYLAGEDAARAADINAAFADPAIAAVFALRGGWGSGRLLPLSCWNSVRPPSSRAPSAAAGSIRFLMRTLAKVPRIITSWLPRRAP